MSITGAVTSGLYAALLFARGRSDGLRYVEADMAGATRSFWAIALCLPAIVCLQLMTWVQSGLPPHAGHAIGLDIMGYVVGWLGFALLSFHLAPMFGCGPRWPRFIAAWNWCNVIENLLLVVGGIPGLLGAPPILDEGAQIVAIGWALWIEWFATKQALGTSGMVAVLLVVLDQLIGLLLAGLNLSLLHQ
ncbi:MAG: hypothetical protein ABSC95_15400 [Acetobacteraceae bacterium]